MSTGKIMTLSVQSLNKLYFSFLQNIIVPNLAKPSTEITHLLKLRSAYQVHRYLEEVLAGNNQPQHYSSHNNTSVSSVPQNANNGAYQYALSTDGHKNRDSQLNYPFSKNNQTAEDEKKGGHKMTMRKALTGGGFEQRTAEKQVSRDDNFMTIPKLTENIDYHPSTPTTQLNQEFKFERTVEPWDKYSNKYNTVEVSKSRVMRDWVRKISKIFNDNHSKIQKYSKKSDPQTKLFSLNVSTRLDRKEDLPKVNEYQFHMRTESYTRKY